MQTKILNRDKTLIHILDCITILQTLHPYVWQANIVKIYTNEAFIIHTLRTVKFSSFVRKGIILFKVLTDLAENL